MESLVFSNPGSFLQLQMQAYERLMRKLLQRSSLPAIVPVQHITWGQAFPREDTKFKKWFHESAEDQYGAVAQVREGG